MTLEHQNVNSMQQSVNSRAAEQGAAHAGGESVAHGAMRQLQTSMQHVAAVVELSGSCVTTMIVPGILHSQISFARL